MSEVNYIKEFNSLYNKVFTVNGDINTVDKKVCSRLIWLARRMTELGTDYGNDLTGQMNISNLQKLYNELHSSN